MSSSTFAVHPSSAARWRSFVWPREHGAWGMLLVPLATGAVLGKPAGTKFVLVFLLAVVALALFCLRTPLEAWLGVSPWRARDPRERRMIHSSIYIYSSVSLGALTLLFLQIRCYGLLIVGAAAAIAFLAQAILRAQGRQTRTAAQLVGSAGLTAGAAAAYYVASGKLNSTALVIWAANWIFAANQILYVQARIHSAHARNLHEKLTQGKWFILGEIAMALTLALTWRRAWLPSLAPLAFLPVLLRGLPWLFSSANGLQVRRLGASELVHAVIFAALMVVTFRL